MEDVSSNFLTFWRRQPTKVVTPEELGFNPYYFMTRDCTIHGGIGDGYHTQEELRQVVQNDLDVWEGSGRDPKKWDIAEESKRLLRAMERVEAAKVDYLPKELRGVDEDLRTRATECMKLAWEMNDGKVDMTVIDRMWRKYDGDHEAQSELRRIAEHLERDS
jgi:hypothetical protein